MARGSKATPAEVLDETTPAGDSAPAGAFDVHADGKAAVVDDGNENASSETIVVLPAADEPVRCGGYVLTDNGWVVEGDPVPGDDDQAEDDPAEDEQE